MSKGQRGHVAHAAQARATLVSDVRRDMQHTSPGALWAMLRAWSVIITQIRRTTEQLPPPDCKVHLRIRLTQRSNLVQYSLGGAETAL